MSNIEKETDLFEKVDEGKRAFLKKLVVGAAFAAPVVHSFSMDGLRILQGVPEARAADGDFGGKPTLGGGTTAGGGGGTKVVKPPPVSPSF